MPTCFRLVTPASALQLESDASEDVERVVLLVSARGAAASLSLSLSLHHTARGVALAF